MDRLDDHILDLINIDDVESWQGTWGDGPPTRGETDPAKVAEIKQYLQRQREARQALKRLGARHVSDLLGETSTQRQWTWERLLPVGSLSLIAGSPKAGKSTLTYQLAVSVARGQPFLGLQTRRTPVLIISAEEAEDDIKDRLRSYGVTAQDKIQVMRRRESGLFYQELQTVLGGYPGMFVLVDSWSRFTGIEDENDPKVIGAVRPFLDLAHEYGGTIHLVHHTRKRGGTGGDEVRGHSSLLQTVDAALVFSRVDGNRATERKIETYTRYTPETITLDYQDGWYVRAETDPTVQDAKVEVACKEPRTIEEISSLTGLDVRTVRYILKARLPERVPRVSGTGHKGDPHRYQTV